MKIQLKESKLSHTTQDEKMFIKNLGKHTLHNENYQGRRDRKALLKGYLAGVSKRKKWVDIDSKAIKKFANSELDAL